MAIAAQTHERPARRPAEPMKPATDPAAWRKEDFAGPADYTHALSAAEIAELDAAVDRVEARGLDIMEIDLATGEVTKVTNDDIYDAAPIYSPDGESMVMTSVVGGFAKLFRIDLDNPTERYPITTGESNETDAVYSRGRELLLCEDKPAEAAKVLEDSLIQARRLGLRNVCLFSAATWKATALIIVAER